MPFRRCADVNDNCDDEAEVMFNESIVDALLADLHNYAHVTVSDCSGNISEHVQTIEVQDTTSPVFTEGQWTRPTV